MPALGTADKPLRCSKLASILKCSMRVYLMLELSQYEDGEGGEAAQTGSLTHAGVAEFHRFGGTILQRKKAAWDAIAAHAADFPLANPDEVRLFITPYMEDPRNQNAKMWWHEDLPMIEQPVDFTLPPHELDESGELIHVQGTFDQIRDVQGVPMIHDLKTGKKTGWEMIHDHAIQIAAYCYGARQKGIQGCQPGPIIRAYGYRTRDNAGIAAPDGVFFTCPIRWQDVEVILEAVRFHVALLRNGHAQFGPGPHCTFCEFGGLPGCLQQFKDLMKRLQTQSKV